MALIPTHERGLSRDTQSMALLNTDVPSLERHRKQRSALQEHQQLRTTVTDLQSKYVALERTLTELTQLVRGTHTS